MFTKWPTRNLARTSKLIAGPVETTGEITLPKKAGTPVSVVEQLRGLARLLTPTEVADILQIHTESVYKLMKNDGLPSIRIGRSRRTDSVLLAAWIEERSC